MTILELEIPLFKLISLFQETQYSSHLQFYLSCHITYSTEIYGGVQYHVFTSL